jgi:tetratricopeptide (TPR) repeat protein
MIAVALASLSPPVAAQAADAARRSRKHYAAGHALYELGNYEAALREFTAGYELLPRPLFLLDIGQCQRKLQDFAKARQSFAEFLERAQKDEPARARAQQLMMEVEREQAAAEAAAEKPSPAPPPAPAPAPVAAPPSLPPATTTEAAPLVATAPPLPPPRARSRRGLILGLTLGGAAEREA